MNKAPVPFVEWMADAGLTQDELAQLVKVNVLTVWRWKKGKSRPQLTKLRRLSQISGGRLTADSFPLSA